MPPNVVLILADDLGYGDLGISGNPLVHTPTLDGLAESGVTLAEHYSGSPVCSPARASLLTGRYPHRTGVIDTREVRGLSRLSTREVTLAQRMQRLGFATGLVGKWHLGSVGDKYAPHRRGFDEFVGFLGGSCDYWNYWLSRNGSYVRGDGTYLTDRLTDEAVEFIRRHRQQPFFLEVAYNAPHAPFQAPESALATFADLDVSDEVKTIYAMISAMDAGIGRIMTTLAELGLFDDTIVVFTSDNGPDMSGSPQFGKEPNPKLVRFNAGLRGSKGLVFDGGVRVPALLHWPAGLGKAQTVKDHPTHFVDWTPTLLEAVGADENSPAYLADDPPIDGTSFMPLLTGQRQATGRRLAWQWNRYEPLPRCNSALRRDNWKLVWPALDGSLHALPEDSAADRRLDSPDSGIPELEPYSATVAREVAAATTPLLFDLASDPGETTDVSSSHPVVVAAMVSELDDWFAEVHKEWCDTVASGMVD